MNPLKKWMLLCAPLALTGCGADIMTITDTGPDTESEPGLAEEARLRVSAKLDGEFNAASAEFGVPAALLKAISYTQTRYEMVVGESEFDGQASAFGLMALRPDQVTAGAQLARLTEEEVRTSPAANIRAAAALLSSSAETLKVDRAQLANWAPAVEQFSGIVDPAARAAYVRNEVFDVLQRGVGQPSDLLAEAGQGLALADEYGTTSQALAAGPDYAPAIWRPSPNFNSRNGVKEQMVIIHTCEGNYSGCWSWQVNPQSGVAAHYTVSTGTEVSQHVRESSRGWHIAAAYKSSLNGGVLSNLNGTSSNNFTIGLEHGGFASQSSFPAAQIDTSAKLVCNITKDQGIVRDRYHVVAHGKLQPNNRTDPGPNWPWTAYLAKINQYCQTTPPPPPPPPPADAIIVDTNNAQNDQAKGYVEYSSTWASASSTPGYYGTGYLFASTAPVSDGVTFFFKLDAPARKTIDAWWTAGTNRSTEAPFVIFNAAGARVADAAVNQTVNGGGWRAIGTFDFTAGWNKVVLSRWATEGSVVIADAIRIR